MNGEDRVLKILLQLKADVAGGQQIKTELQSVQAQATQTAAALSSAARPTFENIDLRNASVQERARVMALINGAENKSIANTLQQNLLESRRLAIALELEAAEARIGGKNVMAGTLEREAQIRAQSLSLQRTLNLSSADAIVLAERLVQAEEAVVFAKSRQVAQTIAQKEAQVAALEAERAAIVALELQAVELRAAGTTAAAGRLIGPPSSAGAEVLEREAEIRTRSLALQRSLNISAAEGLAIAERQVLAEEAILAAEEGQVVATNTMGINLGKARAESLVLGRELAAGNVRASTMSALLGSLGTSLTIAGLGAYELYHLISSQVEQTKELTKEFEKIPKELQNAIAEWDVLATRAQTFADKVKMAEKVKQDLDKMSNDMDAFRAKQLPLWQRFWDDLVTHNDNAFDVNGVLGKPNSGGTGPFEEERRKKVLEETNRELLKTNEELNKADQATKDWAAAEADLSTGLATYSEKLTEAETKLAALDSARRSNPTDRAAVNAYVEQLGVVNDLRDKVNELGGAWEKLKKSEDNANRKTQMQAISVLLREHASLLTSIREQQQLINANPFLSADAKQALTLASMSAELLEISAAIEETKAAMSNSALDPVTHERLQVELKKDQFEFELLKLKISAINAPLTSQLASWVNSFGNSAHQIAGLIEGSINAALQGTNQLLLDAAFRTGDWKQTLVGVERQVADLFLTMLEKMALQQAAQLLGITTTTTAQVASGGAIAAAHAPAAAATSISSYGAAALIGEIAAIAAIVAIMAALGGGFKKGGYTGDGSPDEYAGPAHKGEFYFSASETDNIGLDRLYALKQAAPHFGSGGRVPQGDGEWNPLLPHWSGGPVEPPILSSGPSAPVSPGGAYFGGVVNPHLFGNQANRDWWSTSDDDPTAAWVQGGAGSSRPLPFGGGLQAFVPHGEPIVQVPRGGSYRPPPDAPLFGFIGSNFPGLVSGNVAAGSVLTGGEAGAFYNSSRGQWERYNPASGQFEPVSGIASGFANYDNPAAMAGLLAQLPPGSVVVGRDSVTGAPVIRDPSGRTYVPAGAGSSPAVDRFAQNSGTGNWNADQATKNFLLGGGYPATPNNPGQGDEGLNRFRSGRWVLDAEGGFSQVASTFGTGGLPGQGSGAPHITTDPASILAYNDWVMAHAPHGADGMRVPGPASNTDTLLAWLATGERVITADANLAMESRYGLDWDKHLAKMTIPIDRPHFAAGGRVGAESSAGAGPPSGGRMKLVIVSDLKSAIREAQSEPEYQATIVNAVNGARHELGLPAMQ